MGTGPVGSSKRGSRRASSFLLGEAPCAAKWPGEGAGEAGTMGVFLSLVEGVLMEESLFVSGSITNHTGTRVPLCGRKTTLSHIHRARPHKKSHPNCSGWLFQPDVTNSFSRKCYACCKATRRSRSTTQMCVVKTLENDLYMLNCIVILLLYHIFFTWQEFSTTTTKRPLQSGNDR